MNTTIAFEMMRKFNKIVPSIALQNCVNFIEVAPRDGLQNESKVLSVPTKLEFIERLGQTGIRNIEIGSFVNYTKVPQMQGTKDIINSLNKHRNFGTSVLVPSYNQALQLNEIHTDKLDEIVLFVSTSNTFNQKNIGTDIDGAFKRFEQIKEYINTKALPFAIRGSISCCWACPYEGYTPAIKIQEIIERYEKLGVDMIDICDTIGVATPKSTEQVVNVAFASLSKNTPLSLHLHDTNNLAVASALKGVELGIRNLQGSVAGIGGCPFSNKRVGNVDSIALIEALHASGYTTGIDVDYLKVVRQWILKQLRN
jgi:hydroxymethylglutaryl-CoA lyase